MSKTETKEEKLKRWAKSKVTIYAVTDRLNWGKGTSIHEALSNAKFGAGQKVCIDLYECTPLEFRTRDMSTATPNGTKVLPLTNWESENLFNNDLNIEELNLIDEVFSNFKFSKEEQNTAEDILTKLGLS